MMKNNNTFIKLQLVVSSILSGFPLGSMADEGAQLSSPKLIDENGEIKSKLPGASSYRRVTSAMIMDVAKTLQGNSVDIEKLTDEHGPLIIELMKTGRTTVFSNSDSINRILAQPRIEIKVDAAGYSDSGYNDVQDPQPGGGYKDYSQWIDKTLPGAVIPSDIAPFAGGYNDVQDPQPGGGYKDYSQWIEDDDLKKAGYNDGPQDLKSKHLTEQLLKNQKFKDMLEKNGLKSDYMSIISNAPNLKSE